MRRSNLGWPLPSHGKKVMLNAYKGLQDIGLLAHYVGSSSSVSHCAAQKAGLFPLSVDLILFSDLHKVWPIRSGLSIPLHYIHLNWIITFEGVSGIKSPK